MSGGLLRPNSRIKAGLSEAELDVSVNRAMRCSPSGVPTDAARRQPADKIRQDAAIGRDRLLHILPMVRIRLFEERVNDLIRVR
jgi:hypothetical protein